MLRKLLVLKAVINIRTDLYPMHFAIWYEAGNDFSIVPKSNILMTIVSQAAEPTSACAVGKVSSKMKLSYG